MFIHNHTCCVDKTTYMVIWRYQYISYLRYSFTLCTWNIKEKPLETRRCAPGNLGKNAYSLKVVQSGPDC